MYYLNRGHVEAIKRDWSLLIEVIRQTVKIMEAKDFSQPLKPYLRYRDKSNRIIAMPAFIGGEIDISGIKWIASFPQNFKKGLARAHSVTILNDASTGVPVCTINTPLISGIRTAAVSGLLLTNYLKVKPDKDYVVGISGFGPIGKLHLEMLVSILKDRLKEVRVYDINEIHISDLPISLNNFKVCNSFHEAYDDADIFITATVSSGRYINTKPKPGSLHLNISLRDYDSGFKNFVSKMIVDDWEEVCRENTDIQMMHLKEGLNEEDTFNLIDIVCKNSLQGLSEEETVMFNPMGMAGFDIAIGNFYYRLAVENNVGCLLED